MNREATYPDGASPGSDNLRREMLLGIYTSGTDQETDPTYSDSRSLVNGGKNTSSGKERELHWNGIKESE